MSASELVSKGIIMGTIHVLTGPDHLSALATISATDLRSGSTRGETNWKSRSFLLGVRWGIGHSVGLLVVGGILIGIQSGATSEEWVGMNHWIPTMLETFVGVFMLLLGSYGVVKASRNRRYISLAPPSTEADICDDGSGTLKNESIGPVKSGDDAKSHLVVNGSETEPKEHRHEFIPDPMVCVFETELTHTDTKWDEEHDSVRVSDAGQRPADEDKASTIAMNSSENETPQGRSDVAKSSVTSPMISSNRKAELNLELEDAQGSTLAKQNSTSVSSSVAHNPSLNLSSIHRGCFAGKGHLGKPSTLALLAGVIHGAAGPGGVLGVIPAIEMQDPKLATIYLGTFCVTSTVVMGCFATIYGTLCKWLAVSDEEDRGERVNRVFLVEFSSACLSICVGILWLTLQGLGKMDEMFH